jgi:trk system potassium uptake protein TrkA
MKIVIMGCGRTGSLLATQLVEAGCDVRIVDWSEAAFSRLPDDFPGETIVGNAVDQDILIEAGIRDADAFVAATSGDNRNVMASQIAQHVFHVPKVISRIKDPNRASIYHDLGIEVDCRTIEGAELILDLIDA